MIDRSTLLLRLRRYWPALVIAAAILVSFYPIIFQGHSMLGSPFTAGVMGDKPAYGTALDEPLINRHQLDPGASGWQDEPWAQKEAHMYKAGDLPLWNSSQALGKPLAAAMQSAVFYPLRILLLINPTPLAWNIYMIVRLLVAIVLTYGFLRLIKLDKVASIVGGITFGLSGYFLFFVAEAHINVDIILPLLFISLELIAQQRRYGWPILATAILLMVTGGHPETAFLGGAFALLYFIGRLIVERQNLGRKIGNFLIGAGIGFGLSMFLILPFFELYRFAFTSHAPDAGLALAHDPKGMIINFFYPYFFGWPHHSWSDQWGGGSGTRNYIGVVALYLMSVGIFSWKKYAQYTPIFIILFLIAFTKQYGLLDYSFLTKVPIFNAIGYPKYLGPELTFTGAVLAALGVNYILKEESRWKPAALLAGSALIAFTLYYLKQFFPEVPEKLENKVFYLLLPALAVTIIGVVGSYFIHRNRNFGRVVGTVLAILAIAEMIIWVPKLWPKRVDPYTKPPYVEFLQQQPTSRIFGLNYLLYPNAASVYDLQDIRDLDAVFIDHYFRYVKEFINPSVVDRYTGMAENESKENLPTRFRGNQFFDLLNMRYILTRDWPILDEYTTLSEQLVANKPSNNVNFRTLTINNDTRSVMFQHPESTLQTFLTPASTDTKILFSYGIDQRAWTAAGDGVQFVINVEGEATPVFDRYIDPKNNIADRKWFDGSIDLGRYKGKTISLVVSTHAGANNMNDFSGWANLRLSEQPVKHDPQYKLAYSKEVNIYENTNAFPRAYLVSDVESQNDLDKVVTAMKSPNFIARQSAVVKSDSDLGLHAKQNIPFDKVAIRTYKDQNVVLEVDAPEKSLLVLSDTYYPGWKAFVDNQEQEIYQTDLAIRGVLVDSGKHTVEFRYQPSTFRHGWMISLASLLIAGALLVFEQRRSREKRQALKR